MGPGDHGVRARGAAAGGGGGALPVVCLNRFFLVDFIHAQVFCLAGVEGEAWGGVRSDVVVWGRE